MGQAKSYRWALFTLLFLCFASAILGDSTAEALLLAHFDTTLVPRMFLVNALFLFLFSALLMPVIDRIDRGRFFYTFTFTHGLLLLIIRLVVSFNITFLYLPLFSYAYITKIMLFLSFWTLVNDLTDSRKASTEFPVIAAGGTSGAILISFSIPWLMRYISAENLLLIWGILVLALSFLFLPVNKQYSRHFKAITDVHSKKMHSLRTIMADIRSVRNEPLLWNMSILYFLLFFLLLNQHYTFYSQLKTQYSDASALASFLGFFTGCSMIITIILQLTLAGFILKRIGSTRSMLLLPVALSLIFIVLLAFDIVSPSSRSQVFLFWTITIGMGIRIAFFDSFFSPNFQIFFSSLPQNIRGKGKLSIEGIIKPCAMLVASIWLLFIVPKLPFAVNMVLLFAIACIAVAQTIRLKSKYTASLSKYLTGFSSRKNAIILEGFDFSREQGILNFVAHLLKTEDFEVKSFIIELLAFSGTRESIDLLIEHLSSSDTKVRGKIITALGKLRKPELKDIFIKHLSDTDSRVVANAVLGLAGCNDKELLRHIEPLLQHQANRVRANAVVSLWPYVNEIKKEELSGFLKTMLQHHSHFDCASALYAMGEIDGKGESLLLEFWQNSRERLYQNKMVWRQFVRALGKKNTSFSLTTLLELSVSANRKTKKDLSRALGEIIRKGGLFPQINDILENGNCHFRHMLINAWHVSGLVLPKHQEKLLNKVAHEELGNIYRDWLHIHSFSSLPKSKELEILLHAVREEYIGVRMDLLIHAASLLDVSNKIRTVIPRLYHADAHIRGRAFEVLDNVGNIRINRRIMKLLETENDSAHSTEAINVFHIQETDPYTAIRTYAEGSSKWVCECVYFTAKRLYEETKDRSWLGIGKMTCIQPFPNEAGLLKGRREVSPIAGQDTKGH